MPKQDRDLRAAGRTSQLRRRSSRRVPGSIVAAGLTWTSLGFVDLLAGVSGIGSSAPSADTSEITSQLGSSAVATSGGSVNHSDVASLVVGGLLILMVGVLLLGLGWTTYALFLLGAISVTTLASGGHVEVVIALVLFLVGGGVLLTGNSRAYLGFETNQIDTHPGIARDEP